MEENSTAVNNRLTADFGGLTFSASVLIYFIVNFAVALIITLSGLEQGSDGYVYLSYLAAPVGIIISLFAVHKYKKVSVRKTLPVKCGWKYYVIALLLIFGLLFSLNWVNDLSVKFFELFGYKQREASSYMPDLTGAKIIPALLVIAVFPAVFEEFLFRGAILRACEGTAGTVRTVFIVGFCFALFHGSPEQTVYQFIAGCAFSFVAVRSGSILPSVLMHFINNAVIVILTACNCFNESGALILSTGANIALIVISALSLAGGIIWLILDKKQTAKCEKGSVKSFFIYASAGIAVLSLVWILSLFGVQ